MEDELKLQNVTNITNISIKLFNFRGLEYIDDSAFFEIVASRVNDDKIISEEEKFFETPVNDLQICFTFAIDQKDNNQIFRLFSNPIYLTLMRHECEATEEIAFASVDLLPLFSTQAEERTVSLEFKSYANKRFIRKITFDAHISSDGALLNRPYQNYFLISIDSLYNLKLDGEDSLMSAGIKIPFTNQFDQNLTTTFYPSLLNESKCDAHVKKWCRKSHISRSSHQSDCEQSRGMEMCHKQFKLKINTLMRSMFTHDACCVFHDHIRNSNEIAIEIEWKNAHLYGIIDCEELLQLNRSKIRQIVPLHAFDSDVFKGLYSYGSVFHDGSRPSKRRSYSSSGMFEQQVFAEIEIELEKPLNQEIHEEIGDLSDSFKTDDNHLLEQFKRGLLLTSRRLIAEHGEGNISGIVEKIISSGECSRIKKQLVTDILKLDRNFGSLSHFKSHLTSYVVNGARISNDDNNKLFISNIYSALGLSDEAEKMLLSSLADDRDSEKAWIDYAIFNAREENFDHMSVAIDELLKINDASMLGKILVAYKYFKLRKISESLNCVRSLKLMHGALEELSIIEHVISRSVGNESMLRQSSMIENDVEHERNEILWISGRNESRLNLKKNPFVRCAVFCTKIGCYKFAELCLAEYYSMHGVNFNYLYLLAAIDSARGNFSSALIHLNKIACDDVANHQVHYAQVVEAIVLNSLLTNQIEKAIDLYNTYIVHDCDNFLVVHLLGEHYRGLKEYEMAKEFMLQAVKLLPCHFSLHALAECYSQQGCFDEAEDFFKSAINSNFEAQESWSGLAKIYAVQARTEASDLCMV